jgi:phage protein U
MADVLMTLGPITFSVQEGAFHALKRKLEIRVGKSERAGVQTARQILGSDETIQIEGVVYPTFSGGVARVQSFRDLALTLEEQMLTDGIGNVWGRYVIENVEEDATEFTAYGVPLKQAFRIELGAAGD